MMSKIYPGTCTVAMPNVYNLSGMPEQPKTLKPGQLPEQQIRQFFEKGYLVVEDFFSTSEIDPCLQAIEGVVDEVTNKLHNAGHIKDLYKDESVFTRLAKIDEQFPGSLILIHKHPGLPKAIQNVWGNERLLNMLEQIMGPKVCANPIWNLRCKVPGHPDGEIPWHQDAGYFDPASYGTLLPVVWVPMLDATTENGCLQVIEGGHLRGLVSDHLNCYANTWHVMLDESKMEETLGIDVQKDVRTLPVKKGGFILFNNLIPHRSLSNTSDEIRWSIDLRFQRPGEPEGLYGAMPLVPLRDPTMPDLVPDWSTFESTRHNEQEGTSNDKNIMDDLDTTITGPWMKQWRLVNSNRHTEAAGIRLEESDRSI